MTIIHGIPGYLTIYDAAEVIGVGHSQVARYVREGKLPARYYVGPQALISEDAVKKFVRPPVGNPQWIKKRRRK